MAQSRRDSFRSTLADGSDSFRSTLADGSASFRSTLADGSDSFKSTLADGSDSFRSTLADGSDSFKSTLADGSDSFRSTLADGSDSFKSTLESGHDFMFENCCDVCELDGLQKEAVGFCVDCEEYLCTECSGNHLKPKPCRNHVLLDQHQMPSRKVKKTYARHVMDIKVNSRDDRKTPIIGGCVVLSGDLLVVVDSYNDKVKLIDLTPKTIESKLLKRTDQTHTKIESQLELGWGLWDITQVSATQVAVTSPYTQTIYVVNVIAKTLKLDHTIQVKGQCWGIASINDYLVVSYDEPVKVEIISMEGKVLQTVVSEDVGTDLFDSPWQTAVSKNGQNIYISDWDRGTVTSVDLTGQVQATYKDFKLVKPLGLTVDSAGRVYVCGKSSNNILQLTADLTEIQELLQRSDGVKYPESVCYCEATDRLYIGMINSDVVKVYQLQ